MENTYVLAVDLGASSGRHILSHIQDGVIECREIYRFENGITKQDGHYVWNYEKLFDEIVEGMKRCGEEGIHPLSVAIDTWGVDHVLIDLNGKRLTPSYAYRDSRTGDVPDLVRKLISDEDLYERTGTQSAAYNTIYQLFDSFRRHPSLMEDARRLLMLPDYFVYLLTGQMYTEYTHASTSGLLRAGECAWDEELIDLLGLPREIFLPISLPGTKAGRLLPSIRERVGYDTEVVLAPSHDTASAVLSVPAKEETPFYISSGTWSLMGVERAKAEHTEDARKAGLTNEGGYGGSVRILKNIMGLWMIQSVRKEMDPGIDFSLLAALAETSDCKSLVNCQDNRFLAPSSMTKEIQDACRESGQEVPETLQDLASVIYRSLADCYGKTMRELEGLTGETAEVLHIVGGGSKADILNRLTARSTGVPVEAGPSEATALGNIGCQWMSHGIVKDKESFRDMIRTSFPLTRYEP